jgi:dihydroxyacetone kinase DhaKLM complex PTS-EIIA-like component DhaM
MPRCYFHVHDGDGLDREHIGTEFASIHDARTEAVSVARELCHLWDDLPPGALNKMAVEFTNETGQTVLSVPLPVATGQVD